MTIIAGVESAIFGFQKIVNVALNVTKKQATKAQIKKPEKNALKQ